MQNTKGTGEQNTFQGQENSSAHTCLGAVMREKKGRRKERKKPKFDFKYQLFLVMILLQTNLNMKRDSWQTC